jgi:hypothetical protein
MSDSPTQVAVTVISVFPRLEAYFTPRTKEVLGRQRNGSSPEMFNFCRVYSREPTEADYIDYASRLNIVVDKLNGKTRYVEVDPNFASQPCLDAAIGNPMALPFADGGVGLMTFMFVYDLPFWTWVDGVARFDNVAACNWLTERLSAYFVVLPEGSTPRNPEDAQ